MVVPVVVAVVVGEAVTVVVGVDVRDVVLVVVMVVVADVVGVVRSQSEKLPSRYDASAAPRTPATASQLDLTLSASPMVQVTASSTVPRLYSFTIADRPAALLAQLVLSSRMAAPLTAGPHLSVSSLWHTFAMAFRVFISAAHTPVGVMAR